MTILEYLIQKLQPKYVGFDDQYKAILYALSIPPDTPAQDVLEVLSLLEG